MPLTGMANSIRGAMSRDLCTRAESRKLKELVRARHGVSRTAPGHRVRCSDAHRNTAAFAKFAQRPQAREGKLKGPSSSPHLGWGLF